jgi:predicted O-methyltransferase YrrM
MSNTTTDLEENKIIDPHITDDCEILYNYVKNNDPGFLLEIGTGQTTISISKALQELSSGSEAINPQRFISVDLDKNRQEQYAKTLTDLGVNSTTLVVQDSIDFMRINFQREVLNFIFIDSSHEYRQTILELTLAIPLLKKTGKLFLHDTKLLDVNAAIYIYLCNNKNVEFKEYNTYYGLGVITKK